MKQHQEMEIKQKHMYTQEILIHMEDVIQSQYIMYIQEVLLNMVVAIQK